MNDNDELAEARETIRQLVDSYREAVGVPPSEHQARRLEEMAQRVEAAEARLATAWVAGYYAGVDHEADGQRGPEPANPYRTEQ